MRNIKKITILIFSSSILFSCSSKSKEKIGSEVKTLVAEKPLPVPISIEQLVGTWKYAEVRTHALEAGIAPIGEVLFGVSKDFRSTYATEGEGELSKNLAEIGTEFVIVDNKICSADSSGIKGTSFRMDYGANKVAVYLLNDKELVIEKGPVYRYFTKVK
jgi:hypothetical protein